MKPVFLIGYMGCGKSTLGRALHRLTGWQFVDLDAAIEERHHATVSQIFAAHGEEGFRDIESQMLRECADFQDTVIACGGGTPCFHDNMTLMNGKGTTVWLTTPLERLLERLGRNRAKRPILADKSDAELREFVVAALQAREPYYSQAQCRFCATLLEDKSQIDITAGEFADKYMKG